MTQYSAKPTEPGWYECRCRADRLNPRIVRWFNGKRIAEHRDNDLWDRDVNHYTDFRGPLFAGVEGLRELLSDLLERCEVLEENQGELDPPLFNPSLLCRARAALAERKEPSE